MKSVLVVSTLAAILGLSACNQQDSAVEAQRKVDEARQQAADPTGFAELEIGLRAPKEKKAKKGKGKTAE